MRIEQFEYYEVQEDGIMTPLNSFEKKSDKVYVVVENDARMIFLWKGLSAGVRLKFIGSRAMGDKRKERGYHYKTQTMDEDDETNDFIKHVRRNGSKENRYT